MTFAPVTMVKDGHEPEVADTPGQYAQYLWDGWRRQSDAPDAPNPNRHVEVDELGTLVAADATVRAAYGAVRDVNSQASRLAARPNFVRKGKVFDAASGSYPTVYWPWVVKVAGIIPSPLDAYYLFYSTDHAVAGGIAFATGPTPAGPWTNHGEVYLDTTSGSQTETPSVLYVPWLDPVKPFYLYYQQDSVAGAVGVQSTCLAKSADCLTWTRVGKVIDVAVFSEQTNNGHTGYFMPQIVGERIQGPHLYGAGNYPGFAMSYSKDGVAFLTDPRKLGYNVDKTQHIGGRITSWNHSTVVDWRGQLWWVGILTNFASGEVAKDARIAMAPIAEDRRTLLSRPEVVIDGSGTNESVNIRSLSIYAEGNVLYMHYQCGNNILLATAGA